VAKREFIPTLNVFTTGVSRETKVSVLVNVTPVAYPDDQNAQNTVLDFGNHAPVTYAVLPEVSEPGAFQGIADAARIVEWGHALMQKIKDTAGGLRVQLAKVLSRQ
jgi:hypothetical protein